MIQLQQALLDHEASANKASKNAIVSYLRFEMVRTVLPELGCSVMWAIMIFLLLTHLMTHILAHLDCILMQ